MMDSRQCTIYSTRFDPIISQNILASNISINSIDIKGYGTPCSVLLSDSASLKLILKVGSTSNVHMNLNIPIEFSNLHVDVNPASDSLVSLGYIKNTSGSDPIKYDAT